MSNLCFWDVVDMVTCHLSEYLKLQYKCVKVSDTRVQSMSKCITQTAQNCKFSPHAPQTSDS